jgi:uncharacterized protein (TIGR02246 family)
MRRIISSIIVIFFFAAGPAFAATPSDAVASVEAAWSSAFAKWDLDALASLYTDDATLFGTSPNLFVGKDDVKKYFQALPAGVFKSAVFSDQHLTVLSKTTIITSGYVTFTKDVNGQATPLPFRITLVLVKQGHQWKIVAHHASPKAG